MICICSQVFAFHNISDEYKVVKHFPFSIVTTLTPVSTSDTTRKIESDATTSTTTDIAVTTISGTVATSSTATEIAVTSTVDTVTTKSETKTNKTQEPSVIPSSK